MKVAIIVEGLKDASQIHKAFEGNDDVVTLITEGTKMNRKIRQSIDFYINEQIPIYIMSDPDEAGDQLAHMIQSVFPMIPRLEVDDRQCAYFTGKKFKAGIEYASYAYLKEIICPLIGMEYKKKEYPICWD